MNNAASMVQNNIRATVFKTFLKPIFICTVFFNATAFCQSLESSTQNWKAANAPLVTDWASDINPEQPLTEYPRPMMKRDNWLNLNGIWQFQAAQPSDPLPTNQTLTDQILVPFAWQSALSGIKQQISSQQAWYKRQFNVPKKWQNKNILLHFGAVDWQAEVYVNGRFAMQHQGGFDAFNIDITDFILDQPNQEIIVKVTDQGNDTGIASGKQSNDRFDNPHRYSYSPVSGIWQTVWLEAVNPIHITNFIAIPDIDNETLSVKVNLNSHKGDSYQVKVIAKSNNALVSEATSSVIGYPSLLKIDNAQLWWPQDPFLYDLEIQLLDPQQKVIDQVTGYFGMRKVAIADYHRNNYGPVKRIMLNNKFMFQMGPLDQGYWPDGLYTAPTDQALKWEIAQMKAWGFNMVRKHIKVEPQRWFYWADKLGLLVWQDMPNTFKKMTESEKIQFEVELQRMVKNNINHPSIINWVVFNEHWGAYDVERLTENTMKLDPSRLVTGNSGIDASEPDIDFEVGHIKDNHHYRAPTNPYASNKRAVVNGEYGAIGYKVKNHIWDIDGPWVHDSYEKSTFKASKQAATDEYIKFTQMLLKFKQKDELSGAVYTQWTDVENEMNGLYSYDRKIEKLDKAAVKKANEALWITDLSLPEKTEKRPVNNADAGPESIEP